MTVIDSILTTDFYFGVAIGLLFTESSRKALKYYVSKNLPEKVNENESDDTEQGGEGGDETPRHG